MHLLTLFAILTSALCSTSDCTISMWPFLAAIISAVLLSFYIYIDISINMTCMKMCIVECRPYFVFHINIYIILQQCLYDLFVTSLCCYHQKCIATLHGNEYICHYSPKERKKIKEINIT